MLERGASYVRTTVALREDLYQRLKASRKGMSEALNEILAREFRRDHPLFAAARLRRGKDVREHRDRV